MASEESNRPSELTTDSQSCTCACLCKVVCTCVCDATTTTTSDKLGLQRRVVELTKILAEGGHPSAQNNLGVYYAKGYGVPRDLVKTTYWYQRAAEQGDVLAQNSLGVCYLRGEGVQRDHITSF